MIKPGENSGLIYHEFTEATDDPRMKDEVYVNTHTFKGESCIVVDIAILVELLLTFTCERSIEFRKTDAVYFIRHLGGGLNLMHKIKVKEETTPAVNITQVKQVKRVEAKAAPPVAEAGICEARRVTQVRNVSSPVQTKILDEIKATFTTEEQNMYINNLMMYMNYHQTDDYVVNLDDVYNMIGFTKKENAKRTIENNFTLNIDYKIQDVDEANIAPPTGGASLEKQHGGQNKQKILLNIDTFKNLCMISRTDKAKEIRKYYIKIENVINSIISQQLVPTFGQDQINNSTRLINHFGSQKDVFYMFSFKYFEEMYAKFGIVGNLREFHHRIDEHKNEFGEICFHHVVRCREVAQVESEFKGSSIYRMNKAKLPKKYGTGFHCEIIKLSEAITAQVIKDEMNRIAQSRILDPPPMYSPVESSLELERERTKQIQEKTKQMEIEYKMMELKLKLFSATTVDVE
jgi:phage anti-repressor protein